MLHRPSRARPQRRSSCAQRLRLHRSCTAAAAPLRATAARHSSIASSLRHCASRITPPVQDTWSPPPPSRHRLRHCAPPLRLPNAAPARPVLCAPCLYASHRRSPRRKLRPTTLLRAATPLFPNPIQSPRFFFCLTLFSI
ncbi:hypothetical protein U1Q18_017066 [Sarracenia purpurea var. burkii]